MVLPMTIAWGACDIPREPREFEAEIQFGEEGGIEVTQDSKGNGVGLAESEDFQLRKMNILYGIRAER
jgi:hypothetical protein